MYHTNSYTQNQYDDFFNLTTMNTDQNIYSNSNKTGFLNSDYGNDICEEFNSITRNGNEINIPQENPFEDSDNGFNVKIPDTISINISDDCSSVSSIVKTNEKIFNIEKEKEKINLFTNIKHDDKNEISYEDQIKRFSVKRDRYKNKDNILKKIITAFFNFYLLNAINLKLQNLGIKNYFEKFSLNHINKKNKIKIMNMTLKQFIEKNEAYHKQKNPKKKVDHNVYILNILEKYKKPVLKRILNTSLKELYEAYINSDEFKVNEINRLKKKNMNDWYINRYIFLSKNFLKCSE
jgi:hypothetical protein